MTSRFNTTTTTMGNTRRFKSVNVISMKYLSRKENNVVKVSSKECLQPQIHSEKSQNNTEEDNRDKNSLHSIH